MPRLETVRLVLRPPEYSDASQFAALLQDFDITKNTLTMPHPYTERDACDFVSSAALSRAHGEGFVFSILSVAERKVCGCCGLRLKDGVFDLGYWIGKPYWNRGLATEAGRKVVSFAFNALKAETLTAGWFADNPASGRVLMKLGFVSAGARAEHSLARGGKVSCNLMRLSREGYGRKMVA